MDDKLPPEVIRPLLEPGERLLWSGRPREGVVWRWSNTIVAALSLFWLFVIASVALEADSTGVVIIALLFTLRPLFAIAGPFLEARQRRDFVYGLTDQRVVIASAKEGKVRQRMALGDVFRVDVDERTDRSGEITFRMPRETILGMSARRTTNLVFHLQDDVAQIGAVAERARAGAKLASAG